MNTDYSQSLKAEEETTRESGLRIIAQKHFPNIYSHYLHLNNMIIIMLVYYRIIHPHSRLTICITPSAEERPTIENSIPFYSTQTPGSILSSIIPIHTHHLFASQIVFHSARFCSFSSCTEHCCCCGGWICDPNQTLALNGHKVRI